MLSTCDLRLGLEHGCLTGGSCLSRQCRLPGWRDPRSARTLPCCSSLWDALSIAWAGPGISVPSTLVCDIAAQPWQEPSQSHGQDGSCLPSQQQVSVCGPRSVWLGWTYSWAARGVSWGASELLWALPREGAGAVSCLPPAWVSRPQTSPPPMDGWREASRVGPRPLGSPHVSDSRKARLCECLNE